MRITKVLILPCLLVNSLLAQTVATPIRGTGTAGTPATGVVSIQGVASGTVVPISAAALPLPTLAATSTKQSDGSQKTQIVDGSGNVIGSTSNALDINIKSGNPTTITVTATDLDIRNLSQTQDSVLTYGSDDGGTTKRVVKTDSGGAIQVDIESAPTITVTATDLDVRNLSQTQDSVLTYGSDDGGTTKRVIKTDSGGAIQVDIESSASIAVTNGGTFAVQESGDALTSLQLLDDTVGTVGSAIPTKGLAALGTDGTNGRVLKTDTSGELQIDVLTLPALAAGSNLIGEVHSVGSATTTNAGTTCAVQTTASTNANNCKASAGNVYFVSAVNVNSTVYYLRLYNSSSGPTCSSATGFVESIPIPASTSGAGFAIGYPIPQGYSTGIGFCVTGGGSSTDNTNAATGIYVKILYK